MALKRQLICATAVLFLFHILNTPGTLAEQLTNSDTAMNNLYDSVLQREYAGPVVFPNHQVERKAQRSPSLRLRFGRRSDPDMMMLPSAEKRWWGDVNQKPIRSPSLRLRFGKRNSLDALMNNLALDESTGTQAIDYNEGGGYDAYERVARKPQRLRWGRSVPFTGHDNDITDIEDETESQQRQHAAELLNKLLVQDRLLKNLFEMLRYDFPASVNVVSNAVTSSEEEEMDDEFQREVRKPTPLRLRWGRSTGGAGSGSATAAASQPKQTNVEKTADATKTEAQHAQDKN